MTPEPSMTGGASGPAYPSTWCGWQPTPALPAAFTAHRTRPSGRPTNCPRLRNDLVDQLAESGVVDFGISGGEPLIRRDVLDVAAHAKTCGMAVGVATNGAKLTETVAERLAELGLNRLQVSLDGPPLPTTRCADGRDFSSGWWQQSERRDKPACAFMSAARSTA